MVMMPYLSESQLRDLEARGVSGIDLCGNGVVVVPGKILVFRTGQPNQFPSSAPIKNVYRGTSSVVARVFLLRPEFPSVSAVQAEIAGRGAEIALSTVSRVLKGLEDDLIIRRDRRSIRLLQPEKLLPKLVENFRLPNAAACFKGKAPVDRNTLMRMVAERAEQYGLSLAATGSGSAGIYSVMARDEIVSVYCSQRSRLLVDIPVQETNRFPNIEVVETDDAVVYFDVRKQNRYPWASPIQTYLELMHGDKRDQETAEQVKDLILRGIEYKPS
jgi:hypothetical protein